MLSSMAAKTFIYGGHAHILKTSRVTKCQDKYVTATKQPGKLLAVLTANACATKPQHIEQSLHTHPTTNPHTHMCNRSIYRYVQITN